MKLHHKLYLFFAAIVLLPMLVTTTAASVLLANTSAGEYENRIRSSLAATSAIVSGQAQVLAGDFQKALPAADSAALASGDPARMIDALYDLRERTGVEAGTITDERGRIIVLSGANPDDSPPMISSSTELTGREGARWRVSMYRPINDGMLSSVFESQGLSWAIVDRGGVALGSLEAGDEVAAEPGGEEFAEVKIGGNDVLASRLEIPVEITSREIYFISGVRHEIVGAASRQALAAGFAIMLALSALAAVLGLLLTRYITRPLRKLNRAVTAGIEGDLDQRVSINSDDELGNLAESFNQMQESINNYIDDLRESKEHLLMALSHTGDILGSTSNRQRLVEITAEAARLSTDAHAIWVELFESKDSPGRTAVSCRVPEDFFDESIGDLARRVVDGVSRKAIRSVFVTRLEGPRTMTVFPMVFDEEAIGVLLAVFDDEHPLEESSRQILGALAKQVATALDNIMLNEQQRHFAITDQLTGLYNFRFLNNYLERELGKSRRYRDRFTVAIIDLDDFKAVNDTYGHLAGDQLLKEVARLLRENVRDADTVARYGGEEFVAVLPETEKDAAFNVMEKLLSVISKARLDDYPEVRVTASIGLAGFPEDDDEQLGLLKKADEALYRSKMAGKNRVSAA